MARLSLRGVTTGCEKPDCKWASRALNRHHKRHEAMWLGVWEHRRRHETKWRDFVDRYYEFHPKDVVTICVSHHAEIHEIYDRIIQYDVARVGKPLAKYSWAQAEMLMEKLERACDEWLKQKTPGTDNSKFAARREARRRRHIER